MTDFESARACSQLSEHPTIGAREEELSFSLEMSYESRQNLAIQLGIDIVNDDGEVLASFYFDLPQ